MYSLNYLENNIPLAFPQNKEEYPCWTDDRFIEPEVIVDAATDVTLLKELMDYIPQEEQSKLHKAIDCLQLGGAIYNPSNNSTLAININKQLVDTNSNILFGMVDGIWRGATPPSGEWVEIAPGPRGGRRWKRSDKSSKIFQPDNEGNNVRTESGSERRSGRGSGVESRGSSQSSNSRVDGEREQGTKSTDSEGNRQERGRSEQTLDTSKVSKPVREYLKPEIVTARAEQTPKPDIKKVPESLRKYLISPDGSTHQLEGVAMAINAIDTAGGFLLADGPGAGKTRQMLGIAKTYAMRGRKALLVAPAGIIKPDWKNNSVVGSVGKDGEAMGVNLKLNKGDKPINKGEVHVTTYEQLEEMKNQIDSDTVVIFDEAHGLKNAQSSRSKHGRDVASKALGVVYGSATPADNVKNISYLFRTKLFGDEPWEVTRKRFSIGKLGAINVLNNVCEVFDKLTEQGIMIKREISLDGVTANFDHIELPDDMKKALDALKDQTPSLKAQTLMRQRFLQERFKIPHAVDLVHKELSEGRQVVLFVAGVGGGDGNQPGTAGALKEAIAKSGVDPEQIVELHGGEGGGGKEVVVEFQKGKAKVLITTAQSGGTGHNFDDTTGETPRTQIIITPPFSAIDNSQIWGRTHRLTTKSESRIHYIFADTDVDKWNSNLIKNKMATLNAIVGGESEKQSIPDDVSMGLIDGEWHGRVPPSYGEWVLTSPGPRGGMIWRRTDEPRKRRSDGSGRRSNEGVSDRARSRMGGTSRQSDNQDSDGSRSDSSKSSDNKSNRNEQEAVIERMNQRFEAYKKYFDKFKYKEAAEWVDSLRSHIDTVGKEFAEGELLEERTGRGYRVQYKGTNRFKDLSKEDKKELEFIKKYLDNVGITFLPAESPRDKSIPLIASGPIPSAVESKQKGDIIAEETSWWSKLEEAKLLPGLESAEDIHEVVGRKVNQLTVDVTKRLDEVYGKDKWVIKNYGTEAYAGFGVIFPQRVREIKRLAKQYIHEADSELNKLGYSLYREKGIVAGIRDTKDNSITKFGSENFNKIKDKEVKRLCNIAITNSTIEHGARLPNTSEDHLLQEYGIRLVKDEDGNVPGVIDKDGNYVKKDTKEWKELEDEVSEDSQHIISRAIDMSYYGPDYDSGIKYLVQPAFESISITDSHRKLGITWETGHEARVHATTDKDGNVSIVPYATLPSRRALFPAVFHNDEIKEMEKAVHDTLSQLPASERRGQVYGVDVMKTKNGWKVVETNPSVETAQSVWLQKNPFVIDAFVAHLTNREPAHVKFIRDVLNDKKPHRTGGIRLAIDKHGRKHKEKGLGGGQFVSKEDSITHSKAKIKLRKNGYTTTQDVKEAAEYYLGEGKTKEDFATVVAAPDDSTVTIEIPESQDRVNIFIDHKDFTAIREVRMYGGYYTWIHNKEIFVKPKSQAKGIGLELFHKQVLNASAMEIPAIYATAGYGLAIDGKTQMNGYYTLPRYGYNAKLTTDHINGRTLVNIKKNFPEAKSIRGVMKTEEGRKWWKENGTWIYNMKFDLKPNSKSMKVLNQYMHERNKQKGS